VFETARPFLLALAIGLILGIERERAKSDSPEHDPLGSRTFALIALLGAVVAHVGDGVLGGVIAVAAVGLVLLGYARTRLGERGSGVGTTTEFAAVVTFALGHMTRTEPLLAGMLAVVTLAMLALKPRIHQFAKAGISQQEMAASLTFLVIAFVILPLLPNRAVDPWGLVNPARLWLVVVLIAGIGFGSYIAVRAFGAGWGLPLAGLTGGLVSSTAATLSLSRRSREDETVVAPAAIGIVLANVASAAAQIGIVALVAPALIEAVLPVLGLPVLVGLVAAAIAHVALGESRDSGAIALGNPLALRATLVFAALLGVVLIAVSAASRVFGEAGVLITSAIGGTTDVHAVTLAVANLFDVGAIPPTGAVHAILVAFSANMAVKLALAAWAGGRRIVLRVAPPLVGMVLAGIAGAVLPGLLAGG